MRTLFKQKETVDAVHAGKEIRHNDTIHNKREETRTPFTQKEKRQEHHS